MDTIEVPAILGEITVNPRVDGRWCWTVVVDTSYPPMSLGGIARTRRGAIRQACRQARRTNEEN